MIMLVVGILACLLAAAGPNAAMGRTLDLSLPREWKPQDNFQHRQMAELTRPFGYPLEEHFVETTDGYVLGVYRIRHGRSQHTAACKAPRLPVLLWHGLLDSSATFVVNQPSQSLGFVLADAGYDVWLGNTRGNAFSRNHTGLSPDSDAFWDFTWQDSAERDLPAVVEHVLAVTGASQLAYVAHSQGATIALAALSTDLILRSRFAVASLLGPAAYTRFVSSVPLQLLAAMHTDSLFKLFDVREFLPARQTTAYIFHELCRTTPLMCVSVMSAICGFNPDNLNRTRLPVIVEYSPSGKKETRRGEESSFSNIVFVCDVLFSSFASGSVLHCQPAACSINGFNVLAPPLSSFFLSFFSQAPASRPWPIGRSSSGGPESSAPPSSKNSTMAQIAACPAAHTAPATKTCMALTPHQLTISPLLIHRPLHYLPGSKTGWLMRWTCRRWPRRCLSGSWCTCRMKFHTSIWTSHGV
jgi:pimeloyl-ACP methyl ester carboxylesterase